MATRSLIAIKESDSFHAVYCHWDGYPMGVGRTLLEFYDADATRELMIGGDMSTLGDFVSECETYASRGEEYTDYSVFETRSELLDSAQKRCCEYVYTLEDSFWYVTDPETGVKANLGDVIQEEYNRQDDYDLINSNYCE